MVNLLVRKAAMPHDEFERYLEETHAPIASELPGLERYVTSIPRDASRAAYDAIAELYFEDSAAMKAAFDSEVGQRVQADAAEFLDQEAGETLVVDETVRVDR
ncbi:EthD family reductase [Haloarculaceae archaeon H-GB11]|nr:EthD family reductase [Haloarculaceae archaeon H-GB11]